MVNTDAPVGVDNVKLTIARLNERGVGVFAGAVSRSYRWGHVTPLSSDIRRESGVLPCVWDCSNHDAAVRQAHCIHGAVGFGRVARETGNHVTPRHPRLRYRAHPRARGSHKHLQAVGAYSQIVAG